MKALSTILLTACALAALAAIWQPIGSLWQWLATAVVLLFAGAATGAAADKPLEDNTPPPDRPAHRPSYGRKENDQ